MSRFNHDRRKALKLFGLTGAAALLASAGFPLLAGSVGPARVAVVGGGFGGATAARYLKRLAPELNVTLIEPLKRYYTCPFTNLYLGGLREFDSLGHGYDDLRRLGVDVVHARAESVDADNRSLKLDDGVDLKWDRLVLSPGIDIRWGALEGYDRTAAEHAPHAWQAGEQTHLLKRQLEAMEDGGTFILVAPDNPYRCPPGPYERVSMVANYLSRHKPRSKVLLLDSKDAFSKQPLFLEGWRENYGDMVEWVGRSGDGRVVRVDAERREVETEFGEIHRADVLNVVPPQKAGAIAHQAGVAGESGWVPVEPSSFQSRKVPGIYVIGDATEAAPMPKSGFVANNQAKVTARAILADLAGQEPPDPRWTNTCYSVIAPEWGITVANVFEVHDGQLREVPGSGGISALGASARIRRNEARFAESWYAGIALDTWGTRV
jgi:sulfide dehydrogenase [flavocytochrome c] flavoprotein chain